MELFDTHCHLTDSKFSDDIEDVLKRAEAAGVKAVLSVGTGLSDIKKVLKLAEQISKVKIFCSGGLTPFDVAEGAVLDDIAGVNDLLSGRDSVKAFGEIGLDRYHDYGDPEREEEFFLGQLKSAVELKLPVILHCREAHGRMVELLKPFAEYLAGNAVVHCFSGTYRDASAYLDMGMNLSFTCAVGYKKAEEQRTVLRKIPIKTIMAETDSPYLPPADKRGNRNEPAHVAEVIQIISTVRGKPEHSVCEAVFENSLDFFRIKI